MRAANVKRDMKPVVRAFVFAWLCLLVNGDGYCGERTIDISRSEAALVEKGGIVVRELPGKTESEQCYEAVGIIGGSIDEVFGILVDFENYYEFMPNVSSIDVLESTPSSAVTNWLLSLPLGKTKKYRLELTYAGDTERAYIEWKKRDWPGLSPEETIKDTSGHWTLHASGESATLALYRLCTDPGHVPLGLGWIVDSLSRHSIPETILGTRKRVEDLGS